MKTPPLERFEGRPSEAQRAATARGYIGYFGTYEIDYSTMTGTHIIEGALNPNYVATERERVIQHDGEVLEIEIHYPDGRRAYLRLTRVESFEP